MPAVPNENGTTKADGLKQPSAPEIVTEQINSPGKISKAKRVGSDFVNFRNSADYLLWIGNGLKVCAQCGSKKNSDGYGQLVCPNELPDCQFIKE